MLPDGDATFTATGGVPHSEREGKSILARLGDRREPALTQAPWLSTPPLIPAKPRVARHPWTPSSFQPARPERMRPAQSPQVSPAPRRPARLSPPGPGLSSPEATNHIWLATYTKIKNSGPQLYWPHFELSVATCRPWPMRCTAQIRPFPDTEDSSVGTRLGQGFSVST